MASHEIRSISYLVVCGSDAASLARYQVIGAISEVPIRLAHTVGDAERMLTSTTEIRGVVIDVQFSQWHEVVMLMKRLRPALFAVLFGDPTCSEPTCVNAVVRDQNLISLLDLVQANWKAA